MVDRAAAQFARFMKAHQDLRQVPKDDEQPDPQDWTRWGMITDRAKLARLRLGILGARSHMYRTIPLIERHMARRHIITEFVMPSEYYQPSTETDAC